MMQKLLVPIAAVVLAVLAGIAIWFLMGDSSPKPIAIGNESATPNDPPPLDADPLRDNEFDATRLQPDPVNNQRPEQPFVAPEKSTRIIISGRVVTEDGSGIADARVVVMPKTSGRIIPRLTSQIKGLSGTGYTDATGFYRLLAWADQREESPDTHTVTIAAESPVGGIAVIEEVTIPGEQTFEMEQLVVANSREIAGRVTSADGQPAPGAEITLRSSGPVMMASIRGRTPSARMRPFSTTVFADELGNYKFTNLPAAKYGLGAYAGYFGVTDKRVVVDVTTSSQPWQEIHLQAENMIRGVLTDQGGVPVAGAVVRLKSAVLDAAEKDPINSSLTRNDRRTGAVGARDDRAVSRFNEVRPQSRSHCITDGAGRFGFTKASKGEFILMSKIGQAEAQLEKVTVSPNDYRMLVNVATSIGGIVRDIDTGRVIERFDARVIAADGEVSISPFVSVADNGRFQYRPGGLFAFSNPAAGKLRFRISAPGYMPEIVEVSDVKEGDQNRSVDVSLKPLCRVTARLVKDGRVLDFEPCAILFDDRLAHNVSSDELGRVKIPGVAPATYKVKVVLVDGSELEGSLIVPPKHEADMDIIVEPAK